MTRRLSRLAPRSAVTAAAAADLELLRVARADLAWRDAPPPGLVARLRSIPATFARRARARTGTGFGG